MAVREVNLTSVRTGRHSPPTESPGKKKPEVGPLMQGLEHFIGITIRTFWKAGILWKQAQMYQCLHCIKMTRVKCQAHDIRALCDETTWGLCPRAGGCDLTANSTGLGGAKQT